MRLLVRASLGVFFVFVFALAIMGFIKKQVVEPQLRDHHLEIARGGILAARDALDGGHKSLDQLRASFSVPLTLASDRRDFDNAAAGEVRLAKISDEWYITTEASEGVLAIGPIPDIEPPALMIWLSIGVTLVGAIAGALLVLRPVTRRLRGLESATRKLSRGTLQARAQIGPDDAIGSLERHFNGMADELESLVRNKRELLQAVSHELKTPISRIRFALEMLLQEKSEQNRARRADAIDINLDELDELVDELLTYAKFDGKRPTLATEPLSITALLEREVQSYRDLASGTEIRISAPHEVKLVANERYLKRALGNLLSNALRHARSTVQVGLAEEADFIVLSVGDDGPGIPEEERARVLQPFARVDDSRDRRSGGAGLGLSIVVRIAEWHGATVSIGDSPLGGARISIALPRDAKSRLRALPSSADESPAR